VNFVGSFAVALCLLPCLLRSASSTGATASLVAAGSFTVHAASRRAAEALTSPAAAPSPYVPAQRYMHTKLLLGLAVSHLGCTYGLAGRVRCAVVDPGAVDTDLVREWPAWLRWLFRNGLGGLGLLRAPLEAAAAFEAACFRDSVCPYLAAGGGGAVALDAPPQLRGSEVARERVWAAATRIAHSFLLSRAAP